eukprot:1044449-Pyramimonas_sp.AAC.1
MANKQRPKFRETRRERMQAEHEAKTEEEAREENTGASHAGDIFSVAAAGQGSGGESKVRGTSEAN